MCRRSSVVRTLVVLAWAGGCVLLAPVTSAAAGAADLVGGCTDDTGVTVVVDFPEPGLTRAGCAPWPVADGFAALTAAGFDVQPVQQFPAAVCRLDGVPADSQCIVMPPGTAYWSYWNAERDGVWTFGGVGAASHRPEPGSVEGWAFGGGDAPAVPPPPRQSSADPTAAPAETTSAGDASTYPAAGRENAEEVPDAAETGSDVPVGAAAGIGLVVALGAAAGVTALRRRGRPG